VLDGPGRLVHGAALDGEGDVAGAMRQIATIRGQSITPLPQAQSTGVPVILPRSAVACSVDVTDARCAKVKEIV